MSSIRISGPAGSLAADDGGTGAPAVVLVHSLGGSGEHWRAQLARLRRHRRAVALDLRGHGGSEVPADGDYGIEAMAEESFPDHHVYTQADAERLLARAEAGKLALLTTEKDMARLIGGEGALATLRTRAKDLPVSLVIENEDVLRTSIRKSLAASR